MNNQVRGPVFVVIGITAALIGVSCGPPAVSNSGPPAEVLSSAVASTMGLESFRVTASSTRGGDSERPTESTVDFNSPDRFIVYSSGDLPLIIVVGESTYLAMTDRPGFFTKEETPRGSLDAYPLLALNILRAAKDVSREGDAYVFRADIPVTPSVSVSGKAWLSKGLVTRASILFPSVEVGSYEVLFHFSRFGAAPRVSAPAGDHVLPFNPSLPTCGLDGSPPPGTPVCFPRLPSASSSG